MSINLILHNVRSLHNVGSIFRTADAAGVEKIYLTGYTPSPYDFFGPPSAVSDGGKLRKDFAKTALGAEKFVKWKQTKNIAKVIDQLKKEKVFIFALEQHPKAVAYDEVTIIYDSTLRKKNVIALIVGNEVRGISPAMLKKCDAIIEIPMRGEMVRRARHPKNQKIGKESLNVSVAAGIALFALRCRV